MKSRQIRERLFQEQCGLCWFCQRVCKFDVVDGRMEGLTFTIEHILPRCWGGGNEATNLVGACFRCNHRRGLEIECGVRPDRELFISRWRERNYINSQRRLLAFLVDNLTTSA